MIITCEFFQAERTLVQFVILDFFKDDTVFFLFQFIEVQIIHLFNLVPRTLK